MHIASRRLKVIKRKVVNQYKSMKLKLKHKDTSAGMSSGLRRLGICRLRAGTAEGAPSRGARPSMS